MGHVWFLDCCSAYDRDDLERFGGRGVQVPFPTFKWVWLYIVRQVEAAHVANGVQRVRCLICAWSRALTRLYRLIEGCLSSTSSIATPYFCFS